MASIETLQTEFKSWLGDQLQSLGLDDSAYLDYIDGMIFMEDNTPSSERTDAVVDFVSAATEKNLEEFKKSINDWAEKISEFRIKLKEEQKKIAQENSKVKSTETVETLTQKPQEQKPNLTREEKKKRDELLKRFGFEEEKVDENGDIILSDNSGKEGGEGLKVERNINADKVKAEDALKREKAKAAHQQKVSREKEQREKEALKKEKAKKRTEKVERRGRG